jgi:pyruvate formate lyase activating enzyme
MSESPKLQRQRLEAKSPFELRVNLGKDVPETDVRSALASGDIGFLHSYTTGSAVDGPGVRVVVWTAGCQWRCQYCHNPDTWTMTNGSPVTVAQMTEELNKYRQGLKVMSGGVTVSGGEPLMQYRFVMKFLDAAHNIGVHTAIETNGYFGERLTDEDIEKIDLVLLGLKAWDSEKHRLLTGMDPGPTRELAKRLAGQKRPIWVRFVLVPGLTDDREDIAKIAEFAAGLGNIQRVDVLPFHQLGRFKWKELDLKYDLENVQPPSKEAVDHVVEQFRSVGLNAV